MQKEEQLRQPRRDCATPGYSAIHGYANAVNQFAQFLKFHMIWVGIPMKSLDMVLMKTDLVKGQCTQKVD